MSRTLFSADFCAPRGLGNRHVQTLLPRFLPLPSLARETEIINLPDGDFVELAWALPAPTRADAPVFVLFHGLEGSFDSPYARELMRAASEMGWRAVLMHFRGCGQAPNRLARAYHSGDTADAYWVIGQLALRYPRAIKVAAGVSLGGNMLVKLVAEQGGDGLDLAGAIAISAPLDLAASADALNRGFSRVYQRHLLHALKRKVTTKLAAGPLPITLSARQLEGLETFWAYDNAVTAPLHGFQSASDYYQRASAGRLLGDIELPTLLLHAADDPFMPADLFSRLPAPADAVRLEIARQGGHVGFVESRQGRLGSWLARRVAWQLECWAAHLAPHHSLAAGPNG
ncbi:hydrolase [Chromohalobacter salexigens]|uniref:Hydrolase n=1 Tax=Chromohalobacter moromii TaxID=2860329 RepID=A0A9X2X415_9GAMM|nr:MULTISPECIES: hydrolase [Chromohalobacter]NWO10081.1 hydrolase [Chromohalobacter salexigens]CDQ36143.1 putative hydrolase [Virgibacillus halodenitrificans]MCK2044098.1 hydrolase [Chromohalobacter moromii]MCK2046975.1 hydrolase [Chromohalobacter moromii]MCT8506552.1 hydrolase [Chromohalobacter moromii]